MFEIVIAGRKFSVPASMVNAVVPCSTIVRPAAVTTGLAMLPCGTVARLISLAASPMAAIDVRTTDQQRTLIEIDAIRKIGDMSNEQPLTLELIDDLKRESNTGWSRSGD